MDMKGDRYGYLKRSGAIGVSHKAIAVSGSSRGKGALGSASEEKKGLAKKANIEGNESAHYEKLEKRSLRSLKEGGSEKELRRGHNLSGMMAGSADRLSAKGARRVIKKGGAAGSAVAAERPVIAARMQRRQAVKEARKSDVKGAVKAARTAGRADVKAAKMDPNAARMERAAAGNQARADRQTARGNLAAARESVKAQRSGLREAMQSRKKARRGLGALV